MSKTGFYKGRLGIGLTSTMGMGDGNPRYPLDINGDIRLTGAIVNSQGLALNMVNPDSSWVVDAASNIISYSTGNVGIGTTSPSAKLHIHSTDGGASDSSPQILITRDPESNYNQWASLELRGSYIGNTVPYGVGIRSTYGWDSNNRYYGDFNIYTTDKDNGNARTNRLTVTSEGNVGIGTASPGEKLEVKTGTNFDGIILNNEDGGLLFKAARSNAKTRAYMALYDGTSSAQGKVVFRNDDDSFITGGNLGIGTDSPQSHLHLAGTGDVVLRLQADTDNSGEGDNPMIEFRQDGNLLTGLIGTGNLPTGAGVNDNAMYLQHCGSTGIVFLSGPTQNTQSTSVERMRITPSGNVGIGTTSPKSGLQVMHDQGLTISPTGYGVRTAVLRLGSPYTTDVNSIENYCAKITSTNNHSANYGSDLRFFTHPNGQSYSGSPYVSTERMCILGNGNVGIGTTSPIGKLQVAESTVDGDLDVVFSAAMDAKCRLVLQRNHGTEHSVIGGSNTIIGDTYYPDWCIENGYDAQAGLKFTSKFKTYPGNVATTNDVMFLDMEGNVGINNTTPSAKLDVNGSIKARGIDGGNIGSKFLVTPVTDGTHNNNNVPSLTGAGNWLEYHPHVDFDFILHFTSPYQIGMQIYLKDKQGNIIQEVGLHVGSTTASSGTEDPGYEGNNVALFVYNPEKKMYEFAYSTYWYNWGNDSTAKAAFNEVIDQAMPTDMIVLNGTGYNSRWMNYESETERLRTHFGSTESHYSGGWSSTLFAGIKGYGKILEFDTSSRNTQRAAAVKIGDIHKWDDLDYSVAWTSNGTPNRTEAAALTSSDFCFMYNKYGGRIAKMKIHAVSDSDRVYVTLADGGSGQTAFSIDNNYAFIWPSKVKQGVEQAGGTWPSGAGTYGGWITMQGGQASYYWTADDGKNYYFAFGNKHAGRRRYMVNGTRNRRDDAWPVGSTRGTNVEIRDTHLTIKKRTDKFDYGNQTRMIEFKPYMSDRWNNSGSEFQPYTVKASINSGISSLRPSLNTETGFIAFHTADDGVLDERMRIEYNGNVGIGTSTPEENSRLHINGSHASCRMTTKEHSTYPNFQTNFFYGAHHIDVYQTSGAKGYGSTGNGTPMYFQYYSGGAVKLAGGTDVTSDDRLKHNEKIITNGLDIINQLEPKKYFKSLKRYDEEHNYDLDSSGNPITDDHYKIETGLIAQQVMTIPELKYLVDEVEDKYKIVNKEKIDESGNVILDDDGKPVIEEEEQISLKGRYTVNYQDIFVYNIAATKELYKENQELKTKVSTLESELAAIKQHLGI